MNAVAEIAKPTFIWKPGAIGITGKGGWFIVFDHGELEISGFKLTAIRAQDLGRENLSGTFIAAHSNDLKLVRMPTSQEAHDVFERAFAALNKKTRAKTAFGIEGGKYLKSLSYGTGQPVDPIILAERMNEIAAYIRSREGSGGTGFGFFELFKNLNHSFSRLCHAVYGFNVNEVYKRIEAGMLPPTGQGVVQFKYSVTDVRFNISVALVKDAEPNKRDSLLVDFLPDIVAKVGEEHLGRLDAARAVLEPAALAAYVMTLLPKQHQLSPSALAERLNKNVEDIVPFTLAAEASVARELSKRRRNDEDEPDKFTLTFVAEAEKGIDPAALTGLTPLRQTLGDTHYVVQLLSSHLQSPLSDADIGNRLDLPVGRIVQIKEEITEFDTTQEARRKRDEEARRLAAEAAAQAAEEARRNAEETARIAAEAVKRAREEADKEKLDFGWFRLILRETEQKDKLYQIVDTEIFLSEDAYTILDRIRRRTGFTHINQITSGLFGGNHPKARAAATELQEVITAFAKARELNVDRIITAQLSGRGLRFFKYDSRPPADPNAFMQGVIQQAETALPKPFRDNLVFLRTELSDQHYVVYILTLLNGAKLSDDDLAYHLDFSIDQLTNVRKQARASVAKREKEKNDVEDIKDTRDFERFKLNILNTERLPGQMVGPEGKARISEQACKILGYLFAKERRGKWIYKTEVREQVFKNDGSNALQYLSMGTSELVKAFAICFGEKAPTVFQHINRLALCLTGENQDIPPTPQRPKKTIVRAETPFTVIDTIDYGRFQLEILKESSWPGQIAGPLETVRISQKACDILEFLFTNANKGHWVNVSAVGRALSSDQETDTNINRYIGELVSAFTAAYGPEADSIFRRVKRVGVCLVGKDQDMPPLPERPTSGKNKTTIETIDYGRFKLNVFQNSKRPGQIIGTQKTVRISQKACDILEFLFAAGNKGRWITNATIGQALSLSNPDQYTRELASAFATAYGLEADKIFQNVKRVGACLVGKDQNIPPIPQRPQKTTAKIETTPTVIDTIDYGRFQLEILQGSQRPGRIIGPQETVLISQKACDILKFLFEDENKGRWVTHSAIDKALVLNSRADQYTRELASAFAAAYGPEADKIYQRVSRVGVCLVGKEQDMPAIPKIEKSNAKQKSEPVLEDTLDFETFTLDILRINRLPGLMKGPHGTCPISNKAIRLLEYIFDPVRRGTWVNRADITHHLNPNGSRSRKVAHSQVKELIDAFDVTHGEQAEKIFKRVKKIGICLVGKDQDMPPIPEKIQIQKKPKKKIEINKKVIDYGNFKLEIFEKGGRRLYSQIAGPYGEAPIPEKACEILDYLFAEERRGKWIGRPEIIERFFAHDGKNANQYFNKYKIKLRNAFATCFKDGAPTIFQAVPHALCLADKNQTIAPAPQKPKRLIVEKIFPVNKTLDYGRFKLDILKDSQRPGRIIGPIKTVYLTQKTCNVLEFLFAEENRGRWITNPAIGQALSLSNPDRCTKELASAFAGAYGPESKKIFQRVKCLGVCLAGKDQDMPAIPKVEKNGAKRKPTPVVENTLDFETFTLDILQSGRFPGVMKGPKGTFHITRKTIRLLEYLFDPARKGTWVKRINAASHVSPNITKTNNAVHVQVKELMKAFAATHGTEANKIFKNAKGIGICLVGKNQKIPAVPKRVYVERKSRASKHVVKDSIDFGNFRLETIEGLERHSHRIVKQNVKAPIGESAREILNYLSTSQRRGQWITRAAITAALHPGDKNGRQTITRGVNDLRKAFVVCFGKNACNIFQSLKRAGLCLAKTDHVITPPDPATLMARSAKDHIVGKTIDFERFQLELLRDVIHLPGRITGPCGSIRISRCACDLLEYLFAKGRKGTWIKRAQAGLDIFSKKDGRIRQAADELSNAFATTYGDQAPLIYQNIPFIGMCVAGKDQDMPAKPSLIKPIVPEPVRFFSDGKAVKNFGWFKTARNTAPDRHPKQTYFFVGTKTGLSEQAHELLKILYSHDGYVPRAHLCKALDIDTPKLYKITYELRVAIADVLDLKTQNVLMNKNDLGLYFRKNATSPRKRAQLARKFVRAAERMSDFRYLFGAKANTGKPTEDDNISYFPRYGPVTVQRNGNTIRIAPSGNSRVAKHFTVAAANKAGLMVISRKCYRELLYKSLSSLKKGRPVKSMWEDAQHARAIFAGNRNPLILADMLRYYHNQNSKDGSASFYDDLAGALSEQMSVVEPSLTTAEARNIITGLLPGTRSRPKVT